MDTAVDAIRVSVLGPLEVSDATGRPVRVGGHRVRALLILLALDAGRAVPAQALIDKLWPDDGPADAHNALQSLVSRLRQALRRSGLPGNVLESSPAGYRLSITPAAVDALAFEEQARQGSQALARGDAREAAAQLGTALGAWRGAPLADVADEEFAFAPAARLAELRDTAALDRIEACLALRAADATVIGELRELTARDRLAERPAALLMRALAGAGRQSEALAVYQRTREHLADRLGVDPSRQLERAYLAVLRQEIPPAATAAAAAAPGPPRLRRPPTSFVGRDDDIAAVLKRLGTERLVTLTGPGGVGKTRLATETAAALAVPVWFAELAPVTNPAEVPFAVIDALGLRERSIAPLAADRAGDPAGRLCAALAERDGVLVLDNCEHVIDAAAVLAARLIDDSPRVKILATSREPLQIPGEALHVVAPLATPGDYDLPEACTAYPAVRLFGDRAAAAAPGFEPDAGNAEAVARICRLLDGMPLAIELAAPWLRTLTPAQLAARLVDRFALLTGGSRTALPRHQNLRAVVAWSWDLLSERERVLMRRLAVFPGGATLAAAERVCAAEPGPGGTGLPAGEVLPVLASLVAKSLLTRAGTGLGGTASGAAASGAAADDVEPRYRMLETVRAYGLERLAEAGEDDATRDAAARYYLELVEVADPQLRTRAQRAVEARGGPVDTDRWVSFTLAELASHRGDYAEAARCCEGVLATIAGNRAPWWDSLRAQVTSSLAVAVLRLGDEDRCARVLTEALDAAARWRDHAALATVLDACAVYAQLRADRPDPELPARLLGAAAAVRGAFDESGLDAPGIRRTAKSVLGEDRFTRAYAQGLASGYDSAITLARTLLSGGSPARAQAWAARP